MMKKLLEDHYPAFFYCSDKHTMIIKEIDVCQKDVLKQ